MSTTPHAPRRVALAVAMTMAVPPALGIAGCSGGAADGSAKGPPITPDVVAEPFRLAAVVDAEPGPVPLSYFDPGDCPQVYRIRVDEEIPASTSRLLRHKPEHSESYLTIGREDAAAEGPYRAPPSPIPRTAPKTQSQAQAQGQAQGRKRAADTGLGLVTGRAAFRGPRTDNRVLRRPWFASRALVGPASPDAACFERTWDPLEDALALGWPRLPARLTAVGERWRGARVESRCSRLACFDPEQATREQDKDGQDQVQDQDETVPETAPCTTMSWQEELVEVSWLQPPEPREGAAPQRVATITGLWSDGHPTDVGVTSERTALLSLDHGRLLYAKFSLHHGFLGVSRTVEITAVDDCPGSLAASGWQRPEVLAAAAANARGDLQRTRRRDEGQPPPKSLPKTPPKTPPPTSESSRPSGTATTPGAPPTPTPTILTPAPEATDRDARSPEQTPQ